MCGDSRLRLSSQAKLDGSLCTPSKLNRTDNFCHPNLTNCGSGNSKDAFSKPHSAVSKQRQGEITRNHEKLRIPSLL